MVPSIKHSQTRSFGKWDLPWKVRSKICTSQPGPDSKGYLQISVPSQWHVPILIVLGEMAIHCSSFVARRASRTARILTLQVLVGVWTVPAGFPHIDVPFPTASDFQNFESHLNFYFLFLCSLADPGDGCIPCRRALDAEQCKYHENSLCARLNGMYPSQGFMSFFSVFFKRKMVESVWKIRRIKLVRKVEPTR